MGLGSQEYSASCSLIFWLLWQSCLLEAVDTLKILFNVQFHVNHLVTFETFSSSVMRVLVVSKKLIEKLHFALNVGFVSSASSESHDYPLTLSLFGN